MLAIAADEIVERIGRTKFSVEDTTDDDEYSVTVTLGNVSEPREIEAMMDALVEVWTVEHYSEAFDEATVSFYTGD